jgi:hypothetical protein
MLKSRPPRAQPLPGTEQSAPIAPPSFSSFNFAKYGFVGLLRANSLPGLDQKKEAGNAMSRPLWSMWRNRNGNFFPREEKS